MSVASEINRIIEAKNNIKSAILQKGGTITDQDSLDDYAQGVMSIPSGGGTEPEPVIPEILDTDPLTFVCIGEVEKGDSYLSLNTTGGSIQKSFFYNKNDSGWESYELNTHIPVVVGDLVRFKSDDRNKISESDIYYKQFVTNGIFKCGGTIKSLTNNTTPGSADHCYYNLFRNCNITTPPILSLGTFQDLYCFAHMFEGCTLLKEAPELSTNTSTSAYMYQYTFAGCTSLETPPALPATSLAQYCYSHMFEGCTSLKSCVNLNSVSVTGLQSYCCEYMYAGCTSLTTPSFRTASNIKPATYCYQYMFAGCTSLEISQTLTIYNPTAQYCYQYMFAGCTSLTRSLEINFGNTTAFASFCCRGMFQNCTSLKTANFIRISSGGMGTYSFAGMFEGCTSLTTAPALSSTALKSYCYQYMFAGCTSLKTAPALPATTLQTYCYYYMFKGCTSLTTAPTLPATALVSNCYSYMFQNCSNLNYVKAMFTTTPSTSYTSSWLSGVASSGTFVKNSAATWTTTGVNAVPTGWTIQTADA